MWIYWLDETGKRWWVGYFQPDGQRVPMEGYDTFEVARSMVHYLNGGNF